MILRRGFHRHSAKFQGTSKIVPQFCTLKPSSEECCNVIEDRRSIPVFRSGNIHGYVRSLNRPVNIIYSPCLLKSHAEKFSQVDKE